MSALGLILIIVALLVLRQRIVVILGTAAAYGYLVWGDGRLDYVVLDAWAAADQEVLLSIPLFILAGNIMSRGSIARRLIEITRILTAPVPGGLAIATVLSCAFFAAISGSSTVTLIAVGSIMYPALIDAGYGRGFALGALCAAGTLGIIVPPSIPLILYGVMTETSIADLFIAGIGPAILLTLLLAGYAMVINRDLRGGTLAWGALGQATGRGIFSLFMPVLILGGIYSGLFTPTESAAVAVVYAVLVELFVHRDMAWADLKEVTIETATMLGSLIPMLLMALSINTFLAFEQIPGQMVELISGAVDGATSFKLLTIVLLVVIGCFVDIGSAILILSPLLEPIAAAQGIDPVHFGIIMIVNLELGYLTPPLGLNLIVAMAAFREEFWTIAKAVPPFLVLMLVGLIIVAFWPGLSLFLLS